MAKKLKQQFSAYIKYSSIGLQMIATLLLCAWLGDWADEKMGNKQAYMTIVMMLLGVFASIYQLIRSITKLQKEEDERNAK